MLKFVLCAALVVSTSGLPTQAQVVPIVKADSVSFRGRELLNDMVTAYKGLKSYSCTMELQTTDADGSESWHWRTVMAFQQPKRVSVAFTDLMKTGAASRTVFSFFDGKTVSTTMVGQQIQQLTKPAPKGQMQVAQVLRQTIGSFGPGFSQFLVGNNPLEQQGIPKSLSVEQESQLDGVPVEIIVAKYDDVFQVPQSRRVKTTITCVIGKQDHLLRRFIHAQTVEGQQTITTVETYTGVHSNYDEATYGHIGSVK
jgi:hypothetical protein